jgi:hypothetical protein
MDHFTLIQHFFTRVQCPHCSNHITEEGVALLREEQGMYMVSIHCNHCDSHVGVAMVGVESAPSGSNGSGMGSLSGRLHLSGGGMHGSRKRRFKDPELTDVELERLSAFSPITHDDVLEAHHFVSSLDTGWMKHIPMQLREKFTSEVIENDPLPPLPPELLEC